MPVWRLILDEVRNPLVLILLGADALLALVSLMGGGTERLRDAGLILAVVFLNGVLGFVQNYRAQRGIEALRRLAAPEATALRDGRRQAIPAEELVPGDVALLEEGDRIPADGRLLAAHELHVEEAAAPCPRTRAWWSGATWSTWPTVAAQGRGQFVVTETGMATEVGRVAQAVQAVEECPQPLPARGGRPGGGGSPRSSPR